VAVSVIAGILRRSRMAATDMRWGCRRANAGKAMDVMCKDTVKGWEKSCVKKWNGKECPLYKISFVVNKCKGVLKASENEPRD